MADGRDYKDYKELQLPIFTQWSRVGSVTNILADMENGQFNDAALLWTQMKRDDRVSAVLNVRWNSVFGCPMHHEPAKDTAKGRKVADDADGLWRDICPRSELVSLYDWGMGIGVGIARREWSGWQPRLKAWHPGALWYSISEGIYYLRHQDGQVAVDPDDPNWVLFTPYGYNYARLNGLIRPLAMPFLARQWAFRDRARHSERHGMPFLHGFAPGQAKVTEMNAYKSSLAALGSESVVVSKRGAEGEQWGVELIEAKANSHEVFSAQIDHLDKSIAIVILGQSMSTTGQAGLGSQEKAGSDTKGKIEAFDAEVIADLGQLIERPWVTFNYGDPELTPRPTYEVEPPEDENLKATALSLLGDAIAKLEKYGLDVRATLEQAGATLLTEAETAAKKQELMQEAQQATQTQPVDAASPSPAAPDEAAAP